MKKKLLLTFAILLGCVGFAKADVSINSRNFPDAGFRTWIQKHFNKPNGATLTNEELASVKRIATAADDDFNSVSSMKGVEFFSELEVLSIWNSKYYGDWDNYNDIQSIDLSKNKKLKEFYFSANTFQTEPEDMYLKSVNLSNLPELEVVDIDDHYFSELDLRGNQSSENTDDLKRSDVDNVANTGLNLRGCRNLKVIKLTNGKNSLTVKLDKCINLEELTCTTIPEVKGFDVSFAPNLKIINIDHSKWKNLDLTSLKNLEEFSCKDNNLTRLDLSNCKKLKKLNCSGNPIPYLLGCSQLDSLTSIDVSNCVKLEAFPSLPIGIKTIACDNVKSFANVDINMYPNLTELSAANCDLTTFDATNLHDLTALNLSDNHIAAINIAPTQAVDQEKFKLDQRLDITAIPEQGAYWRVLLPPSVDMGRFYSYDFVDNAAKRSYTLYNEYYNGDQGQQPSFVTNYMPTGSAFKKNIIYQYKTGAYYVKFRKNEELVSNVTIYTQPGASGIDDVAADKVVKGVKYFDLQGHESAEPFSGFNIEVTQYTDGTSQSRKLVH